MFNPAKPKLHQGWAFILPYTTLTLPTTVHPISSRASPTESTQLRLSVSPNTPINICPFQCCLERSFSDLHLIKLKLTSTIGHWERSPLTQHEVPHQSPRPHEPARPHFPHQQGINSSTTPILLVLIQVTIIRDRKKAAKTSNLLGHPAHRRPAPRQLPRRAAAMEEDARQRGPGDDGPDFFCC